MDWRETLIADDLVLAVKINCHSSAMKVGLESQEGSVVSSWLHSLNLPYYFALSGYKDYTISSSNLFKEFKEEQKQADLGFLTSEVMISLIIAFYVVLSHVLNSHCSVTILVLMVDQVFVSGC